MNSALQSGSLPHGSPATGHGPLTPVFATLTSRPQITENPTTLSPFLATHTDSPSPNSCICHSYENNRDVYQLFPKWNMPALQERNSLALPSVFCLLLSAFRFQPPPLLQSFRVFIRFRHASRTPRLRLRFRRASRPLHRLPLPRAQSHSRPGIDRVRPRPNQWPRREERLAASSRRRKNHSRNHRAPAHPRRSRINPARCPLRR